MSEPIQTTDCWDGAVDAYVAQAEPFTSQFCEDAILPNRNDLIVAFKAAGFSDVRIEEHEHDFVLDAALFIADHPMIIANPILAGFAEDERSRVIQDAIIQAQGRSKDDKLVLPSTARFIIGTKA